MNRIFFFIALCILAGCNDKGDRSTYNTGQLKVTVDPAFRNVAEALADAYQYNYPQTKLSVETKKEDLGFLDLLKKKTTLCVMSRKLTAQEIAEYERVVDLKYLPSPFAADAAVFVVPSNSKLDTVSVEQIRGWLTDGSKKIIFDGNNSSNLNSVAQKFNSKPADLQYSTIVGSENLINSLSQYPDKIGVVSLNTFSREFDPHSQQLKSKVKILFVAEKGKSYYPELATLRNMTYPFTRVLYFLTSEGNFNIANGFIRFSCTQIGQLVVEKEGLQPYNLFKREVQMHEN